MVDQFFSTAIDHRFINDLFPHAVHQPGKGKVMQYLLEVLVVHPMLLGNFLHDAHQGNLHPAAFDIVLDNLFYLILLSIFPTILAVSLYFNGLKKVKAHSASILGLIEPLSAVILSVLILHEQISTLEMIGGALILAGVALVTTDK